MTASRFISLSWRGPALVAGVLLSVASLEAASISSLQAFRLNPAGPSAVLNFSAFDANLGTLTGVALSFNATRRHAWGLWNISADDPVARSVHYSAGLAGSTLNLNGAVLHFSDATYGPAATAPLAPVSDDDLAADFFAGYSRFLAGNPPAFALGANGGSETNLGVSGPLPLDFSGSPWLAYDQGLTLSLGYGPGTWTVSGAENAQGASLVDVFGEAEVTYSYRTATVPEEFSLGWFAGFLAILGGLRLRWRGLRA